MLKKGIVVMQNQRSKTTKYWRAAFCVYLLFILLISNYRTYYSQERICINNIISTKIGKSLQSHLDNVSTYLPLGNQPDAKGTIQTLTLDCDTGDVGSDIAITAHHVWGKVWNPFTQQHVDVGVKATLSGYFFYNIETGSRDTQLTFNFGTLDAILLKNDTSLI
jgi:hypothetical protein